MKLLELGASVLCEVLVLGPVQSALVTLLFLLFSGWQPRWFLLCGGILSYYDSPEDAWKGCKGSIQMAVCEIQGKKLSGLQMLFFLPSPCRDKQALAFLGCFLQIDQDTQFCILQRKPCKKPAFPGGLVKMWSEEMRAVWFTTELVHSLVTCSLGEWLFAKLTWVLLPVHQAHLCLSQEKQHAYVHTYAEQHASNPTSNQPEPTRATNRRTS